MDLQLGKPEATLHTQATIPSLSLRAPFKTLNDPPFYTFFSLSESPIEGMYPFFVAVSILASTLLDSPSDQQTLSFFQPFLCEELYIFIAGQYRCLRRYGIRFRGVLTVVARHFEGKAKTTTRIQPEPDIGNTRPTTPTPPPTSPAAPRFIRETPPHLALNSSSSTSPSSSSSLSSSSSSSTSTSSSSSSSSSSFVVSESSRCSQRSDVLPALRVSFYLVGRTRPSKPAVAEMNLDPATPHSLTSNARSYEGLPVCSPASTANPLSPKESRGACLRSGSPPLRMLASGRLVDAQLPVAASPPGFADPIAYHRPRPRSRSRSHPRPRSAAGRATSADANDVAPADCRSGAVMVDLEEDDLQWHELPFAFAFAFADDPDGSPTPDVGPASRSPHRRGRESNTIVPHTSSLSSPSPTRAS